MKRKTLIVMLLGVMALTTACGKTTEPVKQVNVYDEAVYNYTIDTSIYMSAIEDILAAHNNTSDIVNECVNTHSGVITQNLIYRLTESVVDTSDIIQPSEMENMDNPEENVTYTESDGSITVTNEDGTESVLYPIYDATGNVYDYGTLEESEMSLEEIINTPVYKVTAIDGYSDRLVATVSTRFGSNLKVVFSLENDKLSDYVIYR